MKYEALKMQLDAPLPRQLWRSETEMAEWFVPHEPPADREWPVPTTELAVGEIMGRLPHVPRVVCAYTAAEMALPVWLAWAHAHSHLFFQPDEIEVPGRSLDIVRQWLAGDRVKLDAVRMPIFRWETNAEGQRAVEISTAATSAALATDRHRDRSTSVSAGAVYAALGALAISKGKARRRVYRQWWSRCRCRLAFSDVLWADFHW